MNKTELINSMAEKTGASAKDTEAQLKAFIETVEETVANDEKVQLVGFGTFEARKRAAREGRNPQTKEALAIDATVVPVFKAGKEFKTIVKDNLA